MNELIKIEERNGEQLVSARELHKFLEVKTRFDIWFDRMCEYGFAENIDFIAYVQKSTHANNREYTQTDYLLKISMAKEISMIQRNEKGKQAREYFIKCEEAWNSEDMILSRALQIQNKKMVEYREQIRELQYDNQIKTQQIAELKPMKDYVDTILSSEDTMTITQIGADYGKSAKELNKSCMNKD